jgi:predicted RNA-binding Zn ribbon-like protein
MLDLVNTVSWRLDGGERAEGLTAYTDVLDWCVESDLLSTADAASLSVLAASDAATAAQERDLVISAREQAYAALFAADATAAIGLADLYRAAIAAADLVRVADHWEWRERENDLSLPRHRIIRGLAALLERDDLDRLHQCEDAKCGWVYLDTSPRRNRRWCNTKDCGDRHRARAYYARHKAKALP